MKNLILVTLTVLGALAAVPPLSAQTYSIPWHKVAGGGGSSAGGMYSVSGTAGQWDAGKMSGGNLTLDGGFWVAASAIGGGTNPPPTYRLVDLGTSGSGYSQANAVNNSGQILGRFGSGPAFWSDSSSPGASLGGVSSYSSLLAPGLNDSGQIVGYSQIDPSGVYPAQFWANSAASPVVLAPLFSGADITYAYGINSFGEIVGGSGAFLEGRAYVAPVIWGNSASPPLALDQLGGNYATATLAINDSGQIVGFATDSTLFASPATYWASPFAAVKSLRGPGADGVTSGVSQAVAINGSGQIVGQASNPAGEGAVLWPDSDSEPLTLGGLGGGRDTASGINASGQIVGSSAGHAILWLNSTSPPIDLNALIPANSGWLLQAANGINNRGEIVGNGMIGGEYHGFALLPLVSTSNPPPTTVTKIAAGLRHSLFLGPGGSLWAMGMNEFGCLGDGTTTEHDTPEQILPSGVTAVAAGFWHSLFLKSDGSLWGMGYNGYGQLGDGTTFSHATPVQIVSSGVTAIGAAFHGSFFLKSDGSLWAMGFNDWGQLGDGTTADANLPEQIVASGVTAIAVGFLHTLFLKSDGSLWGMGNSSYEGSGALGDGNSTSSPKQIVSSNVTAIAAGYVYSLFVKSDGSLWAMGNNRFGQLGDGTTNNAYAPEQIASSGVIAVAADGSDVSHSLFLKSDGSLWGMGCNGYGQLGDGTTNDSHIPKQIVCSGVTGFAAGFAHTLYVKSDGSLWGTGYNFGGQLGDGTTTDHHTPERIVGNGPIPVLFITSVARVGYTLQLSFVSDACHAYNIQTTTDLASGPWSTILTGVPGNGALVQLTIPEGFIQPQKFFRIQQAQ